MKPTYIVHYPKNEDRKIVMCKTATQANEVAKVLSKTFHKAIEITREPVPYQTKHMLIVI